MVTNKYNQKMTIKNIILTVLQLLLIPLMLTVTNPNASIYGGNGGGCDWMPGDFILMGILLFVLILAMDTANKKIQNQTYKYGVIVFILLVFFIMWIELSVDGISKIINFLI